MYPCCPSTISPTQIVGPLADIRGALVGTEFIYSLKRASDQSQETLQSAQPTRVNTISFWKPADSTRSRSGGGSASHPLIVHGYGSPPPASVVASAPLAGEGIQQASLGTGRPVWVDTDRRTEQSQGSVGNPSLLHRSVGTPRTERECGRTYVG